MKISWLQPRQLWLLAKRYWQRNIWHKIVVVFSLVLALWAGTMYGVAEWYIQRHNDEPLVLGTSFIPSYAEQYGLDPQQTLEAILSELQVKHLRLVSYWDELEPVQGRYDFSRLDWQFALAQKYGAKVTLSIGLRQPRWPECHAPRWTENQPQSVWLPQLKSFMGAIIDHYKDSPQLQSYQLENEYFLSAFGDCKHFGDDRQRLEEEFAFVKSKDAGHPVISSLSNNIPTVPIGQPRPDQFGMSVYKRNFDGNLTHRYFEYPLPSWYFAARAGMTELLTGRTSMLHELQAEPWGPTETKYLSIDEQNKSMSPDRLHAQVRFAKDTGLRTIDLWGAEWWYWRKERLNQPDVWNAAKTEFLAANAGH